MALDSTANLAGTTTDRSRGASMTTATKSRIWQDNALVIDPKHFGHLGIRAGAGKTVRALLQPEQPEHLAV